MRESTIRLAAAGLAVVGFLAVAAIYLLAREGKDVPDALPTLGGICLGALATLLTTFAPAPIPGGRRAGDPPPDEP